MIRGLSTGLLVLAVACGSSSGPAPIDPLAVEYCEKCCDYCDETDPAFEQQKASCERQINEALTVVCPDETEAYYACVTGNVVEPPDPNKLKCDTTACETEWAARNLCLGTAPRDEVRVRILSVPILTDRATVNLGHRGTGVTGETNPLPENSIPSFLAAMDAGADGIELDVEITKDGELIVMHDDTVDRTTNCTGCVSELTFDEIRACRLLNGAGEATDERPPTLLEVYTAIGGNALINVELKVFGPACLTDTTGPEALVPLALGEVTRISGEDRTIFSSFDETAAELVKTLRPGYYSALLSLVTEQEQVDKAVGLNQDAVHPFSTVSAETVAYARDPEGAGLEVNVWLGNTADMTDQEIEDLMQEQIDKGATAIINDEPAILADLLADLLALEP